jgi:hypothetical protein
MVTTVYQCSRFGGSISSHAGKVAFNEGKWLHLLGLDAQMPQGVLSCTVLAKYEAKPQDGERATTYRQVP